MRRWPAAAVRLVPGLRVMSVLALAAWLPACGEEPASSAPPAALAAETPAAAPAPLAAPPAQAVADEAAPAAAQAPAPATGGGIVLSTGPGARVQINVSGTTITRAGAPDMQGWSALNVTLPGSPPLALRLELAPGLAPGLFQELVTASNAGQARSFAVKEMSDAHLVADLVLGGATVRLAGRDFDFSGAALQIEGRALGTLAQRDVLRLSADGVRVGDAHRGPLPAGD